MTPYRSGEAVGQREEGEALCGGVWAAYLPVTLGKSHVLSEPPFLRLERRVIDTYIEGML